MKKIISDFLGRPYPFSFQPSRRIKQILPIGLGVFMFLILFKPFGLQYDPEYIKSSIFYACSGGFAGLLTTVIIPYLFPKFFDEQKWTLKRNLFWSTCIYFLFATLMFLAFNIYSIFHYKSSGNFTVATYFWWIYINLIFGLPLGILVNLVNQYLLLKKHVKIAAGINTPIKFTNQVNHKNVLDFEVDKYKKIPVIIDEIIYIEALGNYININFYQNGYKKITIRETIMNIEQKVASSDKFYKSHRSYLINLNFIEKVSGDSQGLKIQLKGSDKKIPVSRNKIKEFRLRISNIL